MDRRRFRATQPRLRYPVIVIVDYGIGNAKSIQNMLRRTGSEAIVSAESADIARATKLILPGVGHFGYGMASLRRSGLIDILTARATREGVPILGICLGAQLMGLNSEEGAEKGLGWVPVRTIRFDPARMTGTMKVPHMGWAETTHCASGLFEAIDTPARFYYVHSYHFQCSDDRLAICSADHGYRFASGFASGNVFGVQFHPEKSHRYGLQLLRNFASLPAPA